MRRGWCAAALGVSLLLRAAPAVCADDKVAQAKTMFDAGAQAYSDGNFQAAIHAFEEAYKLAPREGVLFSIAQAHRRQYFVDKRTEHLRTAIARYREYLDRVRQGGRRADVVKALAELEPLLARVEPTYPEDGEARPAPAAEQQPTRLVVSCKVAGATIAFDGGAPVKLPFIEEVTPGQHKMKVAAEGYFDDERPVLAVKGTTVAVDVPLREKPARLWLETEAGAQVAVDGQPVGVTPLSAALAMPAGEHVVSVTKAGRKVFSTEMSLGRDERKTMQVGLETTGQRYVSLTLMGAGVLGVVSGGVLAGLAAHQQGVAQEIYERTQLGDVDASERDTYTAALDAREDLQRSAGVALTGGVLLGGVGVVLFLVDFPSLGIGRAPRRDEKREKQPGRDDEPVMEVSGGPGLVGGGVTLRF